MSRRTVSAAIVAALLGALVLPTSAGADLYWNNSGTNSIARANEDGSAVNQAFITGASTPVAIAVNSQYIYWANYTTQHIGRANLDGTNVTQGLIPVAGHPVGLAVDGSHVYWGNQDTNAVGRSNLDGSGVSQALVPGSPGNGATGVAVDGSHVYWANLSSGYVGRANLDGGAPTQAFFAAPTFPYGVAVDSAHIYWTDFGGSSGIGRASINGLDANPGFIPITGNDPLGVAVDDAHVFWTTNSGKIGRANIDGSDPNQSFIPGASAPQGIAVFEPSNKFSFGELKRNKRRGTATLSVDVPGPGELALAGKGLVVQRPTGSARQANASERTVGVAGSVQLLIKSKGRKKRKLRRTGKVKVSANVTFTPTEGTAATQSRKVRLRKR